MKQKNLFRNFFAILIAITCVLSNLPTEIIAEGKQNSIQSAEAENEYQNIGVDNNDELFAGYVEQVFDLNKDDQAEINGSKKTGERFDEGTASRIVYDTIVSAAQSIAAGTQSSTRIVFEDASVLGFGTDGISWTAEDLGLTTLLDGNKVSSEAARAVLGKMDETININKIIDALLADYPYEFYWFDKTVGVSYGGAVGAAYVTVDGVEELRAYPATYRTSFAVAGEYSGSETYTVDTSIASAASSAAANASVIVSAHSSEDDLTKLNSYRTEICNLVDYNHDAVNNNAAYGNPWQLIWVFDNDPSTKVVCEGYSKAFQYLCNQTDFENDAITCYMVNGMMSGGTGAGRHMWNIVTMDDGRNYMADITNCDSGSIGSPDLLFLKKYDSGNVNDGYVFTCHNTDITYQYSDDAKELFTEQELTIYDIFADSVTAVDPERYIFVDQTTQLEYTTDSENADEKPVWTVFEDPNDCIDIDQNGLVTATGNPGDATVKVSIKNGEYAFYTIHVSDYPVSISSDVENDVLYMNLYDVTTVNLYMNPETAGNCRKTLETDAFHIARPTGSVTGNTYFNIQAEDVGTAVITVRTDNDVEYQLTVIVSDPYEETQFTTEESLVYIAKNSSYQLKYTITPESAFEIPTFYVLPGYEDYLSVDSDGVIHSFDQTGYARVDAYLSDMSLISYDIYIYNEPETIEFSESEYKIGTGEDGKRLNLNHNPGNSYLCPKRYVSSDPETVYVDENWTDSEPVVYGLKEGSATIALYNKNGEVCDSAEVTVIEGIANYIKADTWSVSVKISERKKLPYRMVPEDIAEKPVWTVEYSSVDQCFAVDEDGYITGLKAGTGRIRGTITAGDSVSFDVKVYTTAETMRFKQQSYTFPAGYSANMKDELVITPADAVNCAKSVIVSDENVLSLSSSMWLYTYSPGTVNVTVNADESTASASTVVTVLDGYAASISANDNAVYIDRNQKKTLAYTLNNATGNTSSDHVTFTVMSGSQNVSVDPETGEVTGLQYGTAVIEARTALYGSGYGENSSYRCSYTIYVTAQPASLNFIKDEFNVHVGDSGTFYAAADSTESELCHKTYTSDNNDVLSFNFDGSYYARSEGTATITCTADNGVKATAIVHVAAKAASVSYYFNCTPHFYTLYVNDTADLKEHIYINGTLVSDISEFAFESQDENTASVDENGIVTALQAGNTVIMIHTPGSNDLRITVYVNEPLNRIWFDETDYYVPIGTDLNLRHLLQYEDESKLFDDVSFTSSNESVASVSKTMTRWGASANSEGVTVITATARGVSAEFNLHVAAEEPGESISLNESEPFTVHVNYRKKPKLQILPVFADQSAYTLTSEDPSIAEIRNPLWYDQKGQEIVGVKAGETTITAVLNADPSKTVTFTVSVVEGDVDTYQYEHNLYDMDFANQVSNPIPDQPEYTVYVGRMYYLSAGAIWTMKDYMEVPANFALRPEFTEGNNCIAKVSMGKGAAGGPTSYYSVYPDYPFAAVHPGKVVFRGFGSRTITINVEEYSEEAAAEEILNAADPNEAAVFEAETEEEKQAIVTAIETAKENGETLRVEVENPTVENPEESDVTLIAEAIDTEGEKTTEYYDVSLLLKTESENVIANITETALPITVSLPLTPAVKAAIQAGGTPKIVRVHNGAAQVLNCTLSEDGNYITFKTDKFSTYAVVVEMPAETKPITLEAVSLTLTGNIGVNFTFDIPAEERADTYISFTLNGNTERFSAENAEADENGLLRFTALAAAKEMRDPITVRVENEAGDLKQFESNGAAFDGTFTYTVENYFKSVRKNYSNLTELLNLVNAMDTYGKYAQINFKYNTEGMEAPDALGTVDPADLEQFKAAGTGSVTGVTVSSILLSLESDTGVKAYFTVDAGHSIDEYVIKADDADVELTAAEGLSNTYYAQLKGAAAKDLDEAINITITNTAGTETQSITYYPLSYVRSIIKNSASYEADLVDVCKALYWYWYNTEAYFD
ncbi:MAG: hypothetical protein Q4C20_00885 [Erysipelotrichaceae bacterium]|nr:hypothetical protein [Erysipelotrichaceae bacterium]